MAYNNFPVGYQPMYYPQQQYASQQQYAPPVQQSQPQMPAVNQQQQPNNSIIWVQGEAGAKSYLVAPNTTVQLWDSENQTIYLKSADASGMPSMKVLDYKIREMEQSAQPQVVNQQARDYVTRTELDAFENKINAKFAEFLQKEEINDGKSDL